MKNASLFSLYKKKIKIKRKLGSPYLTQLLTGPGVINRKKHKLSLVKHKKKLVFYMIFRSARGITET